MLHPAPCPRYGTSRREGSAWNIMWRKTEVWMPPLPHDPAAPAQLRTCCSEMPTVSPLTFFQLLSSAATAAKSKQLPHLSPWSCTAVEKPLRRRSYDEACAHPGSGRGA